MHSQASFSHLPSSMLSMFSIVWTSVLESKAHQSIITWKNFNRRVPIGGYETNLAQK